MAVTICPIAHRNRPPADWSPMPSQLPGSMPNEPRDRAPTDDPPYKVYRGGGPDESPSEGRPYTLYRSLPRGLRSRLRGEEEAAELEGDGPARRFGGRFGGGGRGPG